MILIVRKIRSAIQEKGKILVVLVSCLLLSANRVMSQEAKKSYLCLPDYATGFSLEKSGEWKPSEFNVKDKKYLLRFKSGIWYWTEFGQEPNPHIDSCSVPNKLGFLECKNREDEVMFNNRTLRFQVVRPYGYVVADFKLDKEMPTTPYYEIGRCSEL